MINKCLDELIQTAKDTRQEEDFEALQNRDYANVGILMWLFETRPQCCYGMHADHMYCFDSFYLHFYFQVKDPSLLRFLVDMRGEDATNKQV